MAKTIKLLDTDYTIVPSSTIIKQTSESNLDICNFIGSQLLDLNDLDEFELQGTEGDIVFSGQVRETLSGDNVTFNCFDYGIILGEIEVRHNFENMTPIEIMEYVINNYTDLTISFSAGVTTSLTLALYPCKNKKANLIFDDMHKLLGTTHYVDKNKVLHVEYEGEETNPLTLTVGSNCMTDSDGWKTDSSLLAKGVTVNGDIKRVEDIEFKSGNGSTTEFTLINPYVDIKVEYPVGTIIQPEVTDITSGDYKIFKETKKIKFNVAPAAGSNNIKIYYVYNIQTNYTIPSTSTTSNPHEVTINKEYLKDVTECRKFAQKYYDKFSNPLRSCRLLVNPTLLTSFRANQRIQVIDNIHYLNGVTINDFFIIKEIEYSFGEDGGKLILTVGDSSQFSYDKQTEIKERIDDFSQTTQTAEIFNEAILPIGDNKLKVTFEVTVDLKTATLPANIFCYDAGRSYVNEADEDIEPSYDYITETDYENLFS